MTISVYILLLGAAVLLTIVPHRRPESFSPVGSLLGEVLSDRFARVTLMVFWWWLGWHFLVA
ncbi:DUF6186 family protein [Leifsonia xyli]|uniref:DUF6186 family protein n=1 Tax=Leifsonia xyli TaxID=1575 RepID=UPI001F2A7CCB|nr:DUF6186 family protein [Leifsonia xyli]